MLKKGIYILLVALFMFSCPSVSASSGRLRQGSIETCNGATYGQHSSDNHWHVAESRDGTYYATGNPIYSDPCASNETNNTPSNNTPNNNTPSNNTPNNNTPSNNNTNNSFITPAKEETKNNDNTLKLLIIDGKEFKEFDDIKFTTTKEKISIEVTTNDTKATFDIKNNTNLKLGENKIVIDVTAEDGTQKSYNINVIRELVLSSDVGIKVIIDEEEVKFSDYKATVYASSSASKITIDYKLNDEKATAEIDKIDKLKTGDNFLKIKVIAEDGSEQNYEITVHKYSKVEETISTILAFVFLGGIGYGIYYLIKKVKNRKK